MSHDGGESLHRAKAAARDFPSNSEASPGAAGSEQKDATASAAAAGEIRSGAPLLSPVPPASATTPSSSPLLPPFNFDPSSSPAAPAALLTAPAASDVDGFHPIAAVSPMLRPSESARRTQRAGSAPEEDDAAGSEHTDMPPTPSVASILADAAAEAEADFGRRASSFDGGAPPALHQKLDPALLPSTPSETSNSLNASPEPPLPRYAESHFEASTAAADASPPAPAVAAAASPRASGGPATAPTASPPTPSAARASFPMSPEAEGERKAQSESDGQLLQSTLAEGGGAGAALTQINLQRGESEPTSASPQQQTMQSPLSPQSHQQQQQQPHHRRPAALSSGDESKQSAGTAGDFSGMGSNHVAPYITSTSSASSAQFLSPTPSASSQASAGSMMRSTSPAAALPQPLSGGSAKDGAGGPLRNSASADFSSASSAPLSAVDQRERAAASAAALAQAEAARKKESLRLKAAEKKSQDAKALRIMKNRMYQKLFSLPASESLIEDYSCAVRKTILLHGRLYLSWNFLCFFSSIFSHKTSLIVGVGDLLWANAASVALLFDNSIRIFVQTGPLPIPKVHQASGQIIPLPGAPLVVPSAYMAPAASTAATGTGNANAVNINTPTPPPSASTTPAPAAATPTPGRERSGSNASSNASPAPAAGGPADLSPLLSAMLAPADAPAESIEALETAALAAVTPRNADREAAAAAAAVPSAVSAERVPAVDLLASVAPSSSAASAATSTSVAATSSLQAHPIVVQVAISSDSYGDGAIATTSNASLDLNAQQLAYLIAIGHPNITMHFFASFLMRDHCLALIEGLLRKRREASPQWVAVQAAWKQIDAARAQANAIAMENAKQAAAEQRAAAAATAAAAAAAAAPDPLRTPPMSPQNAGARTGSPTQSRPSSRPASSASEESVNSFRSLLSSPMQATGGAAASAASAAESFRTPSPRVSPMPPDGASFSSAQATPSGAPASTAQSNQTEEKKSQTTFYTASSVAAAINAASTALPAPLPLPPVVPRLNFSAAPVPADDFRGMEWEEIVPGHPVVGLGVRAFFDAFLNDGAPWTTKSYAQAAGKGDAEWKMSSWFDVHSGAAISSLPSQPPVKLEGPWIRDCSYIKQMKDSPLGPPTTRVHQHAVYTARPDDSQIVLETRTLTPDVPFGDNLYVLERMVIEPAPGGCRVKVSVGVRFIKTPWKMKMFVTLIKSKTREDVQKWSQTRHAQARRNLGRVRAGVLATVMQL